MNDDAWKKWYAALKNSRPDAYWKAINYSEAETINHRIPMKAAASIERAMVMLCCELLEIKP